MLRSHESHNMGLPRLLRSVCLRWYLCLWGGTKEWVLGVLEKWKLELIAATGINYYFQEREVIMEWMMGQKANKNRSRRKQEFKENREDTILQPSILLLFHWQRLLGTRGEGWAADGNKEQFYRFPAPAS